MESETWYLEQTNMYRCTPAANRVRQQQPRSKADLHHRTQEDTTKAKVGTGSTTANGALGIAQPVTTKVQPRQITTTTSPRRKREEAIICH
jgi:hypothetical protein